MRNDMNGTPMHMLEMDQKLRLVADLQEVAPKQAFYSPDLSDEDELDEDALTLVAAAGKMSFQNFMKMAEQNPADR